MPFVFGIILAYLFTPLISYLKKRNFTREGATFLLLVAIFSIILVFSLILLPRLVEELENFSKMVPNYVYSVNQIIAYLDQSYHAFNLPAVIQQFIKEFLQQIEKEMLDAGKRFTEVLVNSVSVFFSLMLAPIITYYILRDMDLIKKKLMYIVPSGCKGIFLKYSRRINKIFIGYLRGQVWVSVIVVILVSISLYILKVKFYLLLGIIAGVTNMIPYIGPVIGAVPAVFIALLSSPLQALGTVAVYVLIQQIESSVVAPKIMSEEVGLHPLVIIFSILAGAELFGIWGLLFAIPLAGITKVVLELILEILTPLKEELE